MSAAPAAERGAASPTPRSSTCARELRRALASPGAADAAERCSRRSASLEPRLAAPRSTRSSRRCAPRSPRRSDRLADDLIAGVLEPRLAPGRELFRICPSPNVVFARDYQFVLGGGAFLSSMAKPARWKEPALARFLFEHALGLGGRRPTT